MCFVSICENRRMKPVEIVLRRERGKEENDRWGKSNYDIFLNTYINITSIPLYNYYIIKKS
jgi:hypothetical protein